MRKTLLFFLVGFSSLLGGIIGSRVQLAWLSSGRASGTGQTTIINRQETKIVKEEGVLQDIVEKIFLSTVAVEAVDASGRVLAKGSGFVVSTDGVIVTSWDLARKSPFFRLIFTDGVFNAKVVKVDASHRTGFLKVERNGLTTLPFYDPQKLSLGERIFFLGFEGNGASAEKFLETTFVKGFHEGGVMFDQPKEPQSFFSGGPVSRLSGEVIGMAEVRDGKFRIISSSVIQDALAASNGG